MWTIKSSQTSNQKPFKRKKEKSKAHIYYIKNSLLVYPWSKIESFEISYSRTTSRDCPQFPKNFLWKITFDLIFHQEFHIFHQKESAHTLYVFTRSVFLDPTKSDSSNPFADYADYSSWCNQWCIRHLLESCFYHPSYSSFPVRILYYLII